MSPLWVRLTSPLWVPVLAVCFGVVAIVYSAREMWREAWSC
jgi:hypothetical protein